MNLRILVFIIISIGFNNLLIGQNIELFGGVSTNKFYDREEQNPHYTSSYIAKTGFNTEMAIDSVDWDGLHVRFSVGFERYSSDVDVYSGGLGGADHIIAQIDKSILSFGFYPANFKILKIIDLNAGLKFSYLLSESYSGSFNTWTYGGGGYTVDLQEQFSSISNKVGFGITSRVAMDFKIATNLVISPQFGYYFGFASEIDDFATTARAQRYYYNIGIQKKIK